MSDFVVPLLLLLGVLIFIHELGHFIAARWMGVKVEKFSLGFGPALLKKRIGETEYVVAALPLGGFVKMLGELPGEELPDEERSRAFNHKPPWQRIVIALAGPVMNLVLPVVLVAGVAMIGLPTPTSRVGAVDPDSPAARAGILPGDRILAVDGQELWQWRELTATLAASEAEQVALQIEREGSVLSLDVWRERDPEGQLGRLGIQQAAAAPVVVVTDPESPAGRAGFESGDWIASVAGEVINDANALTHVLARATLPVEVEARRMLEGHEEVRRLSLGSPGDAMDPASLGLHLVDFQIRDVSPASPAKRAGIQEEDIPLAVDGAPVDSASRLQQLIRASEGEPVELALLRAGAPVAVQLSPVPSPVPGEDGEVETHYAIGVSLSPPLVGGEMRELVVRNPLTALGMGVRQTAEWISAITGGIAQMLRGAIGMRQLAGPIGIGEIAADTFRTSWLQFVSFMGLISVNLAILNLLPVPVLDGGTIVLTTMEWVRGGPLPNRVRDFAQTVGLSFILVLMGFAFWNDLSRHWERILGFFKGLV